MATQRAVGRQQRTHKVEDVPERQAENYVSTYTNLVEISATPWDLRMRFFEVVEDENGNPIREKKAAVAMSPQSAEIFLKMLGQAFSEWTNEYNTTEDDKTAVD